MIDRYCANCRHLKKGAKTRYECDLRGTKVRCPFFATCDEFEAKKKGAKDDHEARTEETDAR